MKKSRVVYKEMNGVVLRCLVTTFFIKTFICSIKTNKRGKKSNEPHYCFCYCQPILAIANKDSDPREINCRVVAQASSSIKYYVSSIITDEK